MNGARAERLLLGALLPLLLAAAWLDFGSPTATLMRARKPWSAWLVLLEPGTASAKPVSRFLLIYHWDRRVLHLVKTQGTDRLEGWEPPRLTLRWRAAPESAQSLSGLKAWLAGWPRTPRFWLAFPRALRALRRAGNPEPSAYDAALLAREVFRLEPGDVRLHVLPAARDQASFFSRVVAAAPTGAAPGPLAVDILNASGEAGVALQATKVLRLRGLDVVDFGNAPTISAFTRLIDHTSSYEEAEAVARILGCESPEIVDELDLSRRERVTVVLGRDFRRCAFLDNPAMKP